MKRWTWAAMIVVVLGVLLVARHDRLDRDNRAAEPKPNTASMEKTAKMTTVKQDVQLTEELCRVQCFSDLRSTAVQLGTGNRGEESAILKARLAGNPHLESLAWYAGGPSPLASAGTRMTDYPEALRAEIAKAAAAVRAGQEYRSSALSAGNGPKAVMGVPGGRGDGLVSVIRQDILTKVESESQRNLRLELYPNPNRKPGMKAAEANNLAETRVRGPEDNQGKSHYYKNQIVVKFKKTPTERQLKKIQQELEALSYERIMDKAYVFTSQRMETKQMIRYFRKHSIEYVEPHYLYNTNEAAPSGPAGQSVPSRPPATKPLSTVRSYDSSTAGEEPNDTLFARYQWNLPLIHAESGWTINKGSGDCIVAVVDTGVDLTHPDLKDRLISGYNAVDSSKQPTDDVGHGSHVAGIIAATVNNSLGIAGLTWNNPIMPVKVLDSSGAGNAYNVAEGVIWATDHGAKVINMSLGNYAESSFLHDAIKYAYNHDVVLVAATGNDNSGDPGYPAAYPEVLAVAATDNTSSKASFSNYGSYVDVAAPGVNIASTYMNNQYASLSGTSMASPHAAALAALIRSANPKLTNKEVMDLMRNTAADLGASGRDDDYGYGQIDVYRALEAAAGGTSAAGEGTEQTLPRTDGNPLSRLLQRLFGR